MAIRYLDEPTTAAPQAAQPAGRIRYLDDTEPADNPMDFSKFMQPVEPTVLPSDQPKSAPRKKVGGFLPIESRGLASPHFFEDIEEFGPEVEQFLATLPKASNEQLMVIRSEIAKMPPKDRGALQDAVYMRHGPSAFGIAGNITSPELVQHADPSKEINLAPGAAGAFGRAVIGSTGPTTGAIAGAAAGSRVPGPPIVKIPATILGVLGGAYAGFKGQELAENVALGEERAATLARQRMADIEAQPGATFAGEVLPSMAFLRPSPSGLKAAGELAKRLTGAQGKEAVLQTWRASSPEARAYLINSAFGSGVDATLQTIREAMREDGIDLAGVGRILAAAGIGASQVDPTKLGRGLGLRNTIDLPAQGRLTDVTPPKAPDVTPTRFDEDPQATAALEEAVAQPEQPKLADIGSEAPPKPVTQTSEPTAPEAPVAPKATEEVAIPEGVVDMPQEKARAIVSAAKDPEVTLVYSHNNIKADIPDAPEFSQVDGFKNGENLFSSNPSDLRAFGYDAPDLPPNTPQGKYSLEQAKALAGAPKPPPTKTTAQEAWVRGETQRNANGDLFYSATSDVADNFGPVRKITDAERPKNVLAVDSKEVLAEQIGYKGDPLAEPLSTPAASRFDALAKAHAQKLGHDAIRYENGTLGAPELHVFRTAAPEAAATPRAAEAPSAPPTPPKEAASAVVAPGEAVVAPTDGPVFTRDEIGVSAPSTSRRKRANGTDGEVKVEVKAPSKITNPENWSRLGDTNRTRATVEGRLTFETGKPPQKTDSVWVVRGGNMGSENVIARNLTYKQAIERAKDFVESANVRRETVAPATDPVVGTDINGATIQQSSNGVYYTFENGRVRTGPAFAEPPAPTLKPASPSADYTVKDWIADIDSGKNVADLPNPSIRGMAELRLRDKKLKDLGSAGRINITPGTTTLGGAAVGGVGGAGYGITQGETPEERLKNAALYGLTFAAAGAGAGRMGGKFALTKPGHRVGRRLGVIEDFPVLNKDISNTRIQLQRIGGILMRGSRLRKPFFDAMRRTEADIASMTDEAKIILADARGKINANTTKGPQRDALEAKLNEVFGDITKIGELPEYLRPVANRIHQIRLRGAAQITAMDGITDATRDTVLENGGNYLARKYAIFNLRNGLEARAYKDSLPKEDINAALDAIQEAWKPKPKTPEQQKLAADMLEQVAQDRTNAVEVIKSLRSWMTDDDAARMAAWIAGGKQSGSDVARRMRALYNELINPTEVTRDEARALLDEFLDRDTLAGFTLGRKQIGGKDVTSLYRKKEIDPRLRKVLGEIKDPLANAYQSIENQANIIGRDKQQREFIRIGEAMGIMTRDPDVALEKGMRPFVESGTQLNSPYDNYDGVFIYPWLRDEFKGPVIKTDEIPKAGEVALKTIKSATALFKWLKLIPAPDSRSVNLIGAYWNNALNGRGINPANGRTVDGIKSVFLANGLITPDGSPNAARLLALREKLIRHRVLDESVLGRDFIENTRRSLAGQFFDGLDETAQREINNPAMRKAYMGGKFVASGREFAAGDDIFRVAGFLAEANRYRRAFPNLPESEIEELAGRVINQTGMTYSEVPYALRELSQLGVVEPFVSFPYSVFRSTANTARLGASELADGLATNNPELAKIGATRLTALAIGATLASGYGLSRALNDKHGVTPEQEEAAKLFGPDYIKDSPLAFDSEIKNGKATFVQMNYLLPTALITEAIEEGLKKAAEDGPVAGVGAGVRSTASQFTGMLDQDRPQVAPVPRTIGMALGLVNEDSFGRPIYNPEDPDKWKKIAGAIGYDWAPGFWSKAVRLYKANNPAAQDPNSPRVYSNKEEFMRFLGRRATTIDAKTVFPSKAYQLNEDYQNATRLYQEGVRKTGTEGPEADAAYAKAEGVINDKFNEMVELRDAARLLGMNDDAITAGFLRGGLSKRLTGQVMQSISLPPAKEVMDAKIERREEQRKAYREIGGDATVDARALVAGVRAQNLPPDQFLRTLESEWRKSRVGMDANGRMTREFADALKAEIERTR